MEFTALALRKSVNDKNEELNLSFASAYESTLKPHHSFVVKPIFNLALKAVPFRKDFYQKLGEDQQKVNAQLSVWLAAFEKQVAILKKFFDDGNQRI